MHRRATRLRRVRELSSRRPSVAVRDLLEVLRRDDVVEEGRVVHADAQVHEGPR